MKPIALFLAAGLLTGAVQANTAALPNPLPLSYLFTQIANVSNAPDIALAQARQQQAQAKQQQASSLNPLKLDLEARLGWREFAEEAQENHRAVFHLQHTLYDFNRTQSATEATNYQRQASNLAVQLSQQAYQLQLVQAFFNVILADYQYRLANENMAIEYVGLDKVREQHQFERISDVDLLAAEHQYQQAFSARALAEDQQRATRVQLANLMGNIQRLADNLQLPPLPFPKLKDLKHYLEAVQDQSPQLKILHQKYLAAQSQVAQAQAQDNPMLTLDGYAGQLDSFPERREGHWRFDLNVTLPLYDGGQTQSKVALAQAEQNAIQAQINQLKQQLNQEVTQLYFTLKAAQTEHKQNQAFGDYADLYLDYSRALYENESKTDLGNAMVRLSEANLNTIQTQFKQALAWGQLNYLLGHPITLELLTQPQTKGTPP